MIPNRTASSKVEPPTKSETSSIALNGDQRGDLLRHVIGTDGVRRRSLTERVSRMPGHAIVFDRGPPIHR